MHGIPRNLGMAMATSFSVKCLMALKGSAGPFLKEMQPSRQFATRNCQTASADRQNFSRIHLLEGFSFPLAVQRASRGAYDAYAIIQPHGTGTNFHAHTEVFHHQIFGQTLWFVYPPDHRPPNYYGSASMSNETLLDWADKTLSVLPPDDRPLECILGPGEMMYIPEGWFHASMSVGEGVAVRIQVGRPRTKALEAILRANTLLGDPKTLNEGVRAARRAARLNPSLAFSIYHRVGVQLYNAGHKEKAIKYMKMSLRENSHERARLDLAMMMGYT